MQKGFCCRPFVEYYHLNQGLADYDP
jgi:hypothetical protein